MHEKQEIRVSAKTVDKALKKAAELLSMPQDSLEYRVVSETKGGFLSFLGRKVEIAVVDKSKSRKERRSRPRHRDKAPAADLSEEQVASLVEDLKSFCEGLCETMYRVQVEVDATLDDDRLVLDIQHQELAKQVAKNGKIPEALEHILRKKPRHLKRELPFRVFVDVCGTRQAREEELIGMARDLSEKVHENKKPIVLNYKNSYDRKIIHMALDKDVRVYTRSIGSGANRKLMILPSKKKEAELES